MTNSKTTEPTRRPWEVYDFGEREVKYYPKTIIVAPTGESICEIAGGWPQCTLAENEANAALIVRAVNNHDALVSAMREFCDYYKGKEHQLGNGQARRSLDKFRAALAAAQETK